MYWQAATLARHLASHRADVLYTSTLAARLAAAFTDAFLDASADASEDVFEVVMQHALVTGFPGFLSKHLVEYVLQTWPQAHITALSEEKNLSDAQTFAASLEESLRIRLHIVIGDVTKMDLGLTGPEMSHVLSTVTHIFHLAANANAHAPLATLRAVNVDGTRNVISVAKEAKVLQRFVHFSTCFVAGNREGVVMEEELDHGQKLRNPYEISKYDAEMLVRQHMQHLPITVVRPAIVVGHSQTGAFDRVMGVYQVILLVMTSPLSLPLPLEGEGDAPLPIAPVDYVAKAAAQLAVHPQAQGRTFHLVDPAPVSVRYAYERITQAAGKKPAAQAFGQAAAHKASSLAHKLLRSPVGNIVDEYLGKYIHVGAQTVRYLDSFVVYNCGGALELLAPLGIVCPRFDGYFQQWTQYVVQHWREKKVSKRPRRRADDPFAGNLD